MTAQSQLAPGGSAWVGFETRLTNLAAVIDGMMHNSGCPSLRDARQLARGVGALAETLADLSERLYALGGPGLPDDTADAYRDAISHLRAAVMGLQRGGSAFPRR